MRVLLQRVTSARVRIEGETVGAIGSGYVLLVGITTTDGPEMVRQVAAKVANLRVFEDDSGAMNRSALELNEGQARVTGDDHSAAPVAMLVISQFTLYANVRKGRRPSFVGAARPEQAAPLVELFVSSLREQGLPVATGRFGADMAVELINDGPVTIWLDSADLPTGS